MRVISQNGTIDVPYDQISVYRDGKCIVHGFCSDASKKYTLAMYSTEEKAEKAMDKLHDRWCSHLILEGGPCSTIECYVQPNYWVLPKVFRFPADDEV